MTQAETEAKLIKVAIDLFGQKGLEAVTTREIAEMAETQQSAISYHFGSKEALYLRCAQYISGHLRERAMPFLSDHAKKGKPSNPRAQMESLVEGLVLIMMREEIAPMTGFIVREQMNPSAAFAVLYDGGMRHIVGAMSKLLGKLCTGVTK